MKIVTVLGARPQFIKAAAVSHALRAFCEEVIVHTGQHYDENMSAIFFQELGIPAPNHHLGVGSGNHGKQTGEMLTAIEELLLLEKPDFLLVYGDTNSTLAGALAASKLLIPVIHIEAGLRSFNKAMPEEQNRILTDHLSALLFAPTNAAMQNLERENCHQQAFQVGDVMFDGLLYFKVKAALESSVLEQLQLASKSYLLATIHRAENTNDKTRLSAIVAALNECGETIVLPLHPRTKKYMEFYGLSFSDNVHVLESLGYLDMIQLESNAKKIITDSGGVQKEAYFLGIPCITLRDETEWVETVSDGWNVLVGASKTAILSAIQSFEPATPRSDFFGDGTAVAQICQIIQNQSNSANKHA